MDNIRILLVDDHTLIRDALRFYLKDDSRFEVVAEAGNGIEALKQLEKQEVDLVIMDISMPQMDGIEATREIRKQYEDIKVLAVTMLNENQHIKQMMKAGAVGYVLKNAGEAEMKKAIEQVMSGDTYYSPQVAETIMTNLMRKEDRENMYGEVKLTTRELEVLELIIKEYTNSEIADALYISPRTVDAHKRNLLEKTGSKNVAGLVMYAINKRLFPDL